ncbi:MAG: thioredoxin domain-containing protein [Bryobacteraceae bacterium]
MKATAVKAIRYFVPILAALFVSGAGNASAQEPLATIDGAPVTADQLPASLQIQLRQIRVQEIRQEYEARSKALEDLILQKILEKEAAARGTTAEALLATETAEASAQPTDREVEAFYLGQRERINRPLEQVRDQLRQQLRQVRMEQARQVFAAKIRDAHKVEILLEPPKIDVSFDTSRIRGKGDAVTIIEFGDFQCPYCQRVQVTLANLLKKYDGKVRLTFRDFPLRSIHPQAQISAEAARCAGEQGKFWEFHDQLYQNPNSLNASTFEKLASNLQINVTQFSECLNSGKYMPQIEEDVRAGEAIGIDGTPAFIINGVQLSGAQPAAAFEKIIDQELNVKARAKR